MRKGVGRKERKSGGDEVSRLESGGGEGRRTGCGGDIISGVPVRQPAENGPCTSEHPSRPSSSPPWQPLYGVLCQRIFVITIDYPPTPIKRPTCSYHNPVLEHSLPPVDQQIVCGKMDFFFFFF